MVIMVKQIHICIKSIPSETGLSRVSQSVGGGNGGGTEPEGQFPRVVTPLGSLFCSCNYVRTVNLQFDFGVCNDSANLSVAIASAILGGSTASWLCPHKAGTGRCSGLQGSLTS